MMPAVSPPPPATTARLSKPYPGTSPFTTAEAALYFGRDREADQVISRIISSRMTVIHAQSGSGKTSLLNARIIPGLEARNCFVVRMTPEDDPIGAVRNGVRHQLVPTPAAELAAIRRACDALGHSSGEVPIGTLFDIFDLLRPGDPRRTELISPLAADADATAGGDVYLPYFCRVLRSSTELESVARIFSVYPSLGEDLWRMNRTASSVMAALAAQDVAERHRTLIARIDVPLRSLTAYFDELFQQLPALQANAWIVLVLDQFEEIFARFRDPGPVTRDEARTGSASQAADQSLPWQLRREFFSELQSLYDHRSANFRGNRDVLTAAAEAALPIRFVISLRDEFMALLNDQVKRFTVDTETSAYHLGLLTKEQARQAIRQPARQFGYDYDADTANTLVDQLAKEDEFVEPTHVQIVCDKLWTVSGHAIATGDPLDAGKETTALVPAELLTDLGGAAGILQGYFQEFLGALPDPVDRFQTLEILQLLITGSGTRNIVERAELEKGPFRDVKRRADLVAQLINRAIIRIVPRLGGQFVEITHEFLIGPILRAIRTDLTESTAVSELRLVLGTLQRLQSSDAQLLEADQFDSAHKLRAEVVWTREATELMLRSAVALGASLGVVAEWIERCTAWEADDPAIVLKEKLAQASPGSVLTFSDLKLANRLRDSLTVTPEVALMILRSQVLLSAGRADRNDIVYWTTRAMA